MNVHFLPARSHYPFLAAALAIDQQAGAVENGGAPVRVPQGVVAPRDWRSLRSRYCLTQ